MTDQLDEAQRLTDIHLAASLSARAPTLPHTGLCHNCREPIPEGAFCGPDEDGDPSGCREDWELRNRV